MSSAIDAKKEEILYWMLEFIKDNNDPPYTEQDISECSLMLDHFIKDVAHSAHKSDFDQVKIKVREMVLSLNAFNEKHNHTIIETDQREGICELVDQVIENARHKVIDDITEEWRER